MISNINNWDEIINEIRKSYKNEKAKDIINKIAATLTIIFAIPFALTLFTNINFSMHMLLAIMIVVIIWVIITMIWFS